MHPENPKSQVVWFDIPCLDLDRAITFYEAVLGCDIHVERAPGFSMGILPHGGSAIGGCLAVMRNCEPSDKGILLYMNCDGRLQDAVDAVEPHGGEVRDPIHAIGSHGHRAIVIDSEGNRVALHSEEI